MGRACQRGGAGRYRAICDEVAADDYRGFTLATATAEADPRSAVDAVSVPNWRQESMMNSASPSSRRLLDPEIAPAIEAFPRSS